MAEDDEEDREMSTLKNAQAPGNPDTPNTQALGFHGGGRASES